MQCVTEARYNIWKTAHFQEKCTISCIPIYLLDGGDIVEITNPVNKQTNRYMVDSFSINLGIDGEMGIETHRLYYVGLEYGEAEMPLVNQIKKGINELGWLSLGEQRIKDCYGLSGSGKNTIVVRFVNNEVGGEQASVTGYLTTKKQTLELDLKDFQNLDFKDENGSSGRSKGDYADRVLAHEMFHAVCNDYYGVDKTIDMPTWFKEGFGELLIGGRDRYTSIGGYDSVKQKKEGLIRKAKSILNGSWDSTSEDYVAANLIVSAIYYLVGSEELKKGFIRLKEEDNVNLNFLLKFIPIAATNDEVKKKVLDQMDTMPIWDKLNDISDDDVCSIGGIHMMNLYNTPLNAENIFNNQSAETASVGFILSFD